MGHSSIKKRATKRGASGVAQTYNSTFPFFLFRRWIHTHVCDALWLRANVCTFLESYLSRKTLMPATFSTPYNHFKRFQLLFIMFSSCLCFCFAWFKLHLLLQLWPTSVWGWTYRKNSFDFGCKDLISILKRVCRKKHSRSSCIFDQYEFWMECTFFGLIWGLRPLIWRD